MLIVYSLYISTGTFRSGNMRLSNVTNFLTTPDMSLVHQQCFLVIRRCVLKWYGRSHWHMSIDFNFEMFSCTFSTTRHQFISFVDAFTVLFIPWFIFITTFLFLDSITLTKIPHFTHKISCDHNEKIKYVSRVKVFFMWFFKFYIFHIFKFHV